jgi:hypothetical protein
MEFKESKFELLYLIFIINYYFSIYFAIHKNYFISLPNLYKFHMKKKEENRKNGKTLIIIIII